MYFPCMTPPRYRSMVLGSCLLSVLLLMSPVQAAAQQWEAAATMQGYVLSPNVVTLPDGTSLVALRKFEPIRSDTFLFYSVASLLTDQQPWPVQLPLPVRNVYAVYESNGPGPSDVNFATESKAYFAMDAFTPSQTLRPAYNEGGRAPAAVDGNAPMVAYQGDLDGDGFQDVLSANQKESLAYITYGDAQEPYLQWSATERDPKASSDFRSTIMMVGRLSGRVCMVRLVFKYDSWDAGYYQLVELNPDDLAERRDTIRSTVLREIANPQRYWYGGKVLRADTVWHFFTNALTEDRPSLKVTLDRVEIRPTVSDLNLGGDGPWFGQRKRVTNWWYPVVMDADRPMAVQWNPPEGLAARIYTCPNTDDAVVELFGEARLPGNNNSYRGGISSLVMIPDYDGDGIEDIVVEHGWLDTDTSSVVRMYTSVFLTTHRQPVSVLPQEQTLPLSDTAHAIDAFRRGASWVAPGAGYCLQKASTGLLYLLDGSAVGTATARLEGADVVLDDTGRLPASAAWFVIGRCVLRLR